MDTFCLFPGGLGLASELDRHLTLQNLLARKLRNGTLRLGGGREVDKSVADGAVGTGVLGDGDGLAVGAQISVVSTTDGDGVAGR